MRPLTFRRTLLAPFRATARPLTRSFVQVYPLGTQATASPPRDPNRSRNRRFDFTMESNEGPKVAAPNSLKRKRFPAAKNKKNKKETSGVFSSTGSAQEVLAFDVAALRRELELDLDLDLDVKLKDGAREEEAGLPDQGSEITVRVVSLSSTGEGLAIQEEGQKSDGTKRSPPKQVYVVQYTTPGDMVRVKVYKHGEAYSVADLVTIITPALERDDTLIKCQYFAKCQGCQFQMMPYTAQLAHKKLVVERAYENFSGLPADAVPPVRDTIDSPLQFGYRTKLTPHFDAPPGTRRRKKDKNARHETCPDIGFMMKGRTIDIEDCPIGTEVVRKGLARERERMKREFGNYGNGATILLRESTERFKRDGDKMPKDLPEDAVRVEEEDHVDIKTCISDFNALTTEYVDTHMFTNPAGAFFQNNNSILPRFVQYIRDQLLPPPPATSPSTTSSSPKIKYLLDAYCGSGFFTITLSSLFVSSIGLDVAESSIKCATENARLNNLTSTQFHARPANQLFELVTFDPDETAVVIDPPRKGCDELFLKQLLGFRPKRVVYVSCNVHTQARDVGYLVRGVNPHSQAEDGKEGEGQKEKGKEEGKGDKNGMVVRYEIESLVGFDFFPQTHHVEGVCVLSRVDEPKMEE